KQIAIALSKPGATTKAASSAQFRERVKGLILQASTANGTDQLKALSLLGRLAQQARGAKGLANDIRRDLQNSIEEVIGPASDLEDPLDRNYLAQTLRDVSFSNKQKY